MPVKYGRVEGLKQAKDELGRFIKALESKPYAILVEESARAQQEANLEVPLDSGRLKAGTVFYVDPGSRKLSPKVVGEAEAIDPETGYDYSEYQHNTVGLHHTAGRKPFYVRDPFNRMVERIDRRFREELNYDR